MNEAVVRTIVVLGSKPNAALPDVAVSVVLSANNAVELAALYREKYQSRVIAFVPSVELKKHEHIQQSFIKSRPGEIILIGDDGNDPIAFVRDTLGLKDAKVSIITFQERNQLLHRTLGWRFWLVMWKSLWARGIGYVFRHALPDIFGKREMEWLAQSTGLNAIFYGMEKFPQAQIIVAGIGPGAGPEGGGGHFNKVGEFMSKTAKADRLTINCWPFSKRPQVFTTDDAMHELGNMPKWQGDVFYFKN